MKSGYISEIDDFLVNENMALFSKGTFKLITVLNKQNMF